MAQTSLRILVQSRDIIGHGFLEDVVTVAQQGASIYSDEVRMSFPHHAVFFLETDKPVPENTPTITYTILQQMYSSKEDLEALSFPEWQKVMRENGFDQRSRANGTLQYLEKFMPEQVGKPLEESVTMFKAVKEEEASLPPSEVVQDVVEGSVSDVEVKEPEVTVKKRGPKGK